MKVSIKDFQIVKSANLEFVPGLTVIQGESNNGKSALFRAIKSCIYNEPGTTNVRVGCKNYMVGIEHNNHKVILQKGENSLYLIDGKQYNKIGKSQLDEVKNVLGISALSVNGNTEKINFWDQMEKPFLLDRNSSYLFRFIVDSGEDDNLNTTLRSMVTDKNKLNVDKNLKEGSVTTLKEQIDEQSKLLADADAKIELCENVISFGPRSSLLLNLNHNINNINTITNNIKETEEEINTKKTIQSEITNRLSTLSYKMSTKAQLEDIVNKYTTLDSTNKELRDILANTPDIKAIIPKLESNITTLTKLNSKLEKVDELNKLLQNKVTSIKVNVTTDQVNKLNTLGLLLNRISSLNNNVANIDAELNQLSLDNADVLKEYNSIEICPYCNQRIIHNDVTKGGSQHE